MRITGLKCYDFVIKTRSHACSLALPLSLSVALLHIHGLCLLCHKSLSSFISHFSYCVVYVCARALYAVLLCDALQNPQPRGLCHVIPFNVRTRECSTTHTAHCYSNFLFLMTFSSGRPTCVFTEFHAISHAIAFVVYTTLEIHENFTLWILWARKLSRVSFRMCV